MDEWNIFPAFCYLVTKNFNTIVKNLQSRRTGPRPRKLSLENYITDIVIIVIVFAKCWTAIAAVSDSGRVNACMRWLQLCMTRFDRHSTASQRSLKVNGVGTNFGVGVGEARPEGPRAGDGVLGEGTASPSPPTRSLWERCKILQRSPGRSHGRRWVFLYSEPSDCLSQHLSTCCIQFAWLGIRFF